MKLANRCPFCGRRIFVGSGVAILSLPRGGKIAHYKCVMRESA